MPQPDRASQLVTSSIERLRTSSTSLTSSEIKERALVIAGDLAKTSGDNDMTAWYCKAYKTLGESKYEAVVKMARAGRKPSSLFGWLLAREMKALQK